MSHYMSCCSQNPGSALGAPLDPPGSLPAPSNWPQGVSLDTLGLARMPRRKDGTTVSNCSKEVRPWIRFRSDRDVIHFFCSFQIDWAANIRKAWDFSEEGAHARLEAFLQDGETPAVRIVHTSKNVWRNVMKRGVNNLI